jgi:hypothetical protein
MRWRQVGGQAPMGLPISQSWPNGSTIRPRRQPCSFATGDITVAPAPTARSSAASGSSVTVAAGCARSRSGIAFTGTRLPLSDRMRASRNAPRRLSLGTSTKRAGPASSDACSALLAVVGVNLIVIVVLVASVLSRRRWLGRQPGHFPGPSGSRAESSTVSDRSGGVGMGAGCATCLSGRRRRFCSETSSCPPTAWTGSAPPPRAK